MNFNEYQVITDETATFDASTEEGRKAAIVYCALGIGDESGEVLGKIKKWLRGDTGGNLDIEQLKKELGDVLWYMAQMSKLIGVKFEDVAISNVTKIRDRKARGVVKGSGDNR